MPDTNKREYAGQRKNIKVTPQKGMTVKSGANFPKVPMCKDGNYECTAAGKTKLKGM